ncbi:carboxymuconolactone decarboxylase family protein [Roseomonas sp. NAR14]|uniref:Carboxymuconolactone decarboxylase family protein n=1 Tax=Roseomonas acroporae TaxID=2937791 RepID=A0A9X1YBU3_9PROT|nr:carboxymuconolactone decarboxylase family protein [Roseomonas acroporae]MCK8786095.1 carboxymuconolactone decarboxylase family protein [Roseomonas acroporae]
MARVPLPTRDEFPESHRDAYDRMVRERGDPTPHVFLALANMPNLLDALLTFTREMRHGAVLDARYRELGIMMTAHVARSAYEFEHHWNHAVRAGVRREQLEALDHFETSPLFDVRERAVLRYAAEATSAIEVTDATWSGLTDAFTVREAMDLVMAVAWYNAVARINGPLRIANEPWFRRV